MNIPHIAKLACLRISDDEMPQLRQDLAEITAMAVRLPDLTEPILPDAGNPMTLRKDVIIPDACTPEELLRNAPQVQDGCVAIPQTVKGENT